MGLRVHSVITGSLSFHEAIRDAGADLGGGCRGCRGCAPPPPPTGLTCGFLIQLVFCKKKKTMWFIGVEVEQETSARPPKKNPGSAPGRRSDGIQMTDVTS